MSALNPKKLKVILTSLREAITTAQSAAAESPSTLSSTCTASSLFSLLLVSELASRGAGVDLNTGNNNGDDGSSIDWIANLLESIRGVAGKVAIDDATTTGGSSYPAPMMAALNAASGMAASACALVLGTLLLQHLGDDDESNKNSNNIRLLPMEDATIRESVLDTMKRCQEVNDGRFYTLLKLAHDLYSEGKRGDDNESSEKEAQRKRRHDVQQLKHNLTTIAYSNYLYGATHFATDQPPIWKRCLDAALENCNTTTFDSATSNTSSTSSTNTTTNYKSYSTSQVILPLQNMIRIAKSKGKETRAKELSLFLAVGYVGGVEERLVRIKTESSSAAASPSAADGKEKKEPKLDKLSMHQLLQSYYLHRTSTLVEIEDSWTCKSMLDLAKESLASCDSPDTTTIEGIINSDNYETCLLYHYIQVRVQHLSEESTIWIDVQRQHRAMMNRRQESSGKGGGGGGMSIGISSQKSSMKSSSTKSIGSKGTTSSTLTTSTATTREEMESHTRSRLYLDAWNSWKLDSSGKLDSLSPLREVVMELSSLSPPEEAAASSPSPSIGWYTSMDIVQDCYSLLIHQVQRLVDIAVIAQKDSRGKKRGGSNDDSKGGDVTCIWQSVFFFVSPLVSAHLHPLANAKRSDGGDNGMPTLDSTLRRLMEHCSEAIITASWMCEPSAIHGEKCVLQSVSEPLLSMAHACLMACQKERTAEEKREHEEKKKEASVLSSQDGRSDLEKRELLLFQCALATSKCRMELENAAVNGSDEPSFEVSMDALTAASRRATIAATSNKSSSDLKSSSPSSLSLISSNAKFGTPYLQFLSAWSGMHHSPPWPFCMLGQARTILRNARDALSVADKVWGRESSSFVERVMLDVGEADLEGGLMGGVTNLSEKLYRQAMGLLEEKEGMIGYVQGLLKVHCLLGLAKLSLSSDSVAAEELARNGLEILSSSLDPTNHQSHGQSESTVLLCMYPWNAPSLYQLSHSYYVCAFRQLVAEACIRSSRPEDARAFLTDAVQDFPGNFEAALALAAFHLRTMLGNENDEKEAKKTRILLLKAAKMDTTKPAPFALLGVWYESQKDASRAKGCYQKALATDPSHPVAGRGLRRLVSLDEIHTFSENAAKRNSPVNGWAWRVMGQRKSQGDGDDTTAVVCFQQALRCMDIQVPGNDILGAFYSNPTTASLASQTCDELTEVWTELAACYRRLGKYSAALRAYEAAYSVSDGNLSPDALCAWARVDLDLGLYEEASEKGDKVLSLKSSSVHIRRMAAYIGGQALLFLARTDIQEGKFGSCLSHLEKGIARLSALSLKEDSGDSYYCEVKLLGDLYSFGHSLPSYVFATASSMQNTQQEGKMGQSGPEIESQLSFIKKGEQAYTLAAELGKNEDLNEEDNKYLIAAAVTDLGTNLLSQARVLSSALGEGSGGGTKTSLSDLAMQSSQIKDLITRSINAYLFAVDSSPHEAPAWCGLGCALIAVDPLLSQHAFSRALQIDPSLADSWSNIGLLIANFSTEKCSEILDYLTQVEDTPLMWVGRGLLLEKTSRAWKDQDIAREACLTKAADAYRAALQIMQHPAALLGLSLTCRRTDPSLQTSNNKVYSTLADHASTFESRMSMEIHQNMTNEGNIGASYVSSLTQIEEGLNRLKTSGGSDCNDLITRMKTALNHARLRPGTESGSVTQAESKMTECEIDLSKSMSLHLKKTAEFPLDLIKDASDKASSASSSERLDEIGHCRSSCNGLDGARNNVRLNPESGEVWLLFAKRLAQELSSETKDFAMLSSAKIAAEKAYGLLHDMLVNAALISPRRAALQGKSIEFSDMNVVSSIPSASLLSESMSLLSWLEEAEALKNGDSPTIAERSFASLQESFLLDPSNPIAAASLGIST
ncbi:hypothetical protein ACHAXR_012876 [Thalassiosira sp. AJA248-18]